MTDAVRMSGGPGAAQNAASSSITMCSHMLLVVRPWPPISNFAAGRTTHTRRPCSSGWSASTPQKSQPHDCWRQLNSPTRASRYRVTVPATLVGANGFAVGGNRLSTANELRFARARFACRVDLSQRPVSGRDYRRNGSARERVDAQQDFRPGNGAIATPAPTSTP